MDPSPFQPEYDVVVVGAGPAGLMASLCLTTYGFSVLHIDNRETPTTAGRADGIQPRTIEVLRNIGGVPRIDADGNKKSTGGLAEELLAQGVRVYEVSFWDPTETQALARTSRAPSCPSYIDVCDPFTLLLHQGLIEWGFLDEIEARSRILQPNSGRPYGGVYRPYEFKTFESNAESNETHPVVTTIVDSNTKKEYKVKSKYLLGCDGARSLVRRSMAGGSAGDGEWQGAIKMEGEASDIVWGVMDIELKTDFPDIMSKCLIHSKKDGSIMVIPRENGLCRLYVQLQQDVEAGSSHYGRDASLEICVERARKIMHPFQLEIIRTDWFSVYQIGQRIASRYTLDNRVLIGGDATHTHSPKAGQGMNISMLDMYSLAWKINLVEKGMAKREVLIPTYEQERRGIAQALLAFDKKYSTMFSGRAPKSEEMDTKKTGQAAVDAKAFIETFKQNAFFTSGCGAIYNANILNILPDSVLATQSKGFNPKGIKLVAGQRLLPGLLTRAVDANRVWIQQEVPMNGAFRIMAFAGTHATAVNKLRSFSQYLDSPDSFVNTHRPKKGIRSSILASRQTGLRYLEPAYMKREWNPFFTFLTVISTPHTEWDIEELPDYLRAYRDQVYSDDTPSESSTAPMHFKYGINVEKGAIIVVRPDGYVGATTSFDETGFAALDRYFAAFLERTTEAKNSATL